MTPSAALARHVAAVRETAGETGIAIGRPTSSRSPVGHPVSLVRRFDVRFFAAFVPPGTEIGGGSDGVAEATWLRPDIALAAARRGRWNLAADVRDAPAARRPRPARRTRRRQAAFAVGDARVGRRSALRARSRRLTPRGPRDQAGAPRAGYGARR
jgi:hypothetical protein